MRDPRSLESIVRRLYAPVANDERTANEDNRVITAMNQSSRLSPGIFSRDLSIADCICAEYVIPKARAAVPNSPVKRAMRDDADL
jgi:hypothetical protein